MALLPPRNVALLEGVRRDDYLDALLFRVGEDVIYGGIILANVVDNNSTQVERVHCKMHDLLESFTLERVTDVPYNLFIFFTGQKWNCKAIGVEKRFSLSQSLYQTPTRRHAMEFDEKCLKTDGPTGVN